MRHLRIAVLSLVLLSLASLVSAQVEVRFYLVPKIGDGLSFETAFRPKYIDVGALGAEWNVDGRWVAMDYGMEDSFLLKADVTIEEHTLLNAQTDVIAVPTPLSSNVSPVALTIIQNRLEGMNLPAQWVTTGHTYLQVLRTVRRIITFMQRYQGLFARRFFEAGITLDTQINQLTQVQRQRLQAVADSFNLNTAGVTNTMTIRQALKLIADQLPDIALGGEVL